MRDKSWVRDKSSSDDEGLSEICRRSPTAACVLHVWCIDLKVMMCLHTPVTFVWDRRPFLAKRLARIMGQRMEGKGQHSKGGVVVGLNRTAKHARKNCVWRLFCFSSPFGWGFALIS